MIIYNIDVEHEGGQELSFRYPTDTELMENQAIDDHLGRGHVVLTVSAQLTPDPRNPEILLGTARARPV
jgi:hypothetical protein